MNLRIGLFAGALLLLVGWPVYSFVSEAVTGGIHDRGSNLEVDLKAMGFFKLDPRNATRQDVPARYLALDGRRVLLKGLVEPTVQAGSEITEFTLLYSPVSCCGFGGPPQVQEKVFATAFAGRSLHYAGQGYYEVVGTLHVTMKRDEAGGEVVEVYHLDTENIHPL